MEPVGVVVTLTRLAVVVALVVVGVAALAPSLASRGASLRERLPDVHDRPRSGEQGGAQISPSEFAAAEYGLRTVGLRARVGEPERTTTAEIEGVSLECWYYGVADATGAYQLCFVDGRLSSKSRFAAPN